MATVRPVDTDPPLVSAVAPPVDELAAVVAVSAAVAEGAALDDTLAQIAQTATAVVGAVASAIYLREEGDDPLLSVVESYGLSDAYVSHLNSTQPLVVGEGPSGLAIARAEPITVDDILADPICEPWRPIALEECVRAMVSVPLRDRGGFVIGGLNVYRRDPGPWTSQEVNLLSVLGDQAAIAIRTARLLDDARRQVEGLSLIIRSLRAQGHEHSNRLHAIYGLLTIGEVEQARRMIAKTQETYHSVYGRVTGRIQNPTLAGFLVAESAIALQAGIELSVDARSRLAELPRRLDDLDALTLLGNLIHNAVDAVADMPHSRRRITVRIGQDAHETTFRVRDWGIGITGDAQQIFDRGFTTKAGHSGIGLSLVNAVVRRSGGRIDLETFRAGGVAVTVTLPS